MPIKYEYVSLKPRESAKYLRVNDDPAYIYYATNTYRM